MENTEKSIFEQVVEENKAKIYRICRVYAVAPIAPDDLFQEAVFQLWKSLSTFNGTASMSTWVYRIALNVCMRYKNRLESHNGNMIRLEAIQFQLSEAIPDLAMQEKYDALYDCIRSLNDGDQSIAILVLDGLSYKEIADITGLTENHIAVKMKRMKKVLLKCITSKINKR